MRVTKRGLLRGALALALLLLLANLALVWLAERALAQAEAEAPDLRTRMIEFVPPPIPRASNPSSHLNAAGELCSLSRDELETLPPRAPDARPRAGASPVSVEAWRDVVRRNELPLRILDAAAGLDRAWFEADYAVRSPFEIRLPPLVQRRTLANVVRFRAMLAAHEGRADIAYQDVMLLLRMSDWCASETPTLIGALNSLAIAGIAADTLEAVMSVASPGPGIRSAVEERLSRLRSGDPIRHGLEGERTAQYATFEAIVDGHTTPASIGLPRILGLAPLRFYVRLEQAACLRATTTLIRRVGRTTFELTRDGHVEGPTSPTWLVLTRTPVVPSLSRAVRSRDELRARLDLGLLALGAEDWRATHGSYPDGPLETWWRGETIDPITGAPYRYETRPDGFALRGPPGRSPELVFTVRAPTGAPDAEPIDPPPAP